MNIPHDFARTSELDRMLVALRGGIPLLAAVTPTNAASERARLISLARENRFASPKWQYDPLPTRQAHAALVDAARAVRMARTLDSTLRRLYEERLDELSVELCLVEARGQRSFGRLARDRYDEGASRAADALAHSWQEGPSPDEPVADTDADGPKSLVSEMKRALYSIRSDFVVRVVPNLAALAATGDGTVWISGGRRLAWEDVRRTVDHEVFAHVVPRMRARREPLGLFRMGVARGSDEQEGYALLVEERRGHLRPRRKYELGLRHTLCSRMLEGATWCEAIRWLIHDRGLALESALRLVERTYRGGDGTGEGLGRERVYIASYWNVANALRDDPSLEDVLTRGQVSVAAAALLRPYVAESMGSPRALDDVG